MARFLNPYNFVRPLPAPRNLPPLSEDTADVHLLWRCPPPPHDRYTGLSGRITCTMTAKTPVFVCDSEFFYQNEEDEKKKHKTYRFFNVNGQDMIPASSLRGSIRSVFEAATNSTWSIFSDKQLSYRAVGDILGLIPARLSYDPTKPENERWRATLLPGTSSVDFSNGCRPSGKMYAAWVHFDKLDGYSHGQVCFAALTPGQNNNWVVQGLAPLKTDNGEPGNLLLRRAYPRADIRQGVLSISGDNFPHGKNPKRHERFFFRDAKSDEYTVSPKVIARYNSSLKQMREYHAEAIRNQEPHLSRFLTGDWERESIHPSNPLLNDDNYRFPVYVHLRLDPNTEKYEVDYIAPVAVPRVPEEATLYEVLEREGFRHLLPCEDYNELSPADRLFGWVHQKGNNQLTQNIAYRGRVRFSHAIPEGKPKTLERMSLSILSAPKPTTTRFYVNWRKKNQHGRYVNFIRREMGDERTENVQRPSEDDLRYGKRGNMLRGRKFYRHHGQFNEGEAKIHDPRNNSDQNRSIVGAHQEGTVYSFTIDFENLQPVELGALLWTLELQDEFVYDDDYRVAFEGFHRIGYGKPLGFGSIKIEVKALALFDAEAWYTNASNEMGWTLYEGENCKKVIKLLSTRFKQALGVLYGKTFERLTNIVDLCTLLSTPILGEGVTIHYPRPRRQRGMCRMSNGRTSDNNFEWFRDNKRPSNSCGPNLVLVYAPDDIDGFPHMIWDKQAQEVRIIDE